MNTEKLRTLRILLEVLNDRIVDLDQEVLVAMDSPNLAKIDEALEDLGLTFLQICKITTNLKDK